MVGDVKRVQGEGRKQLAMLVKGLDGAQGRVGWFETAKYEDGTPIAGIAGVQEFGSPKAKIPPRSFMRSTIAQQRGIWRSLVARGSKLVLQGGAQPLEVMEKLAMQASGDISKKITQIWAPPLARRTVMARIRRLAAYSNLKTRSGKIRRMKRTMKKIEGSKKPMSITKPLVDTGALLSSLTYDVEQKK